MPSQVAASSDRQQLLLTALRQADRELSGQDLHALLRQGSQPMGLATVYRHLRQYSSPTCARSLTLLDFRGICH